MALAIGRLTVFVVLVVMETDWRLAVGDPSIRSTAFVCVAAVLAASTCRNKEGMEIKCSQSRPLLGAICPTWNGRCRGLSEAAMGTDPEMADWRGRATGAFQWLSGATEGNLPRHLWLELFRCCDL